MAGYIRQSTFVDGDTITAALFNNEYNQLVNAFSNTSGHKHDGTTAEGPVIGLIGDAGETSPNNKVLIDTTNNFIEFYVQVSDNPVQQLYIADGAIIPVTDSDIDLGTTSLRFKDTYTDTVTTTGNVSIGGDLTVTGSATISGNLTFGDADTDSINLAAEIDSDIIPNTDGTYDLGSATKEWQDLYIDGTANIDSLIADTADINGGTIDGATIGGTTAGAVTFTDLSDGTITVTAFADEDDMSSDSATLVPTQQSVKAYVDAQVTAQDLDITTDSGTIAIDLDSETLTVTGGTGLDSSATGNAVTLAIDSTVATLTGTQTLTNKTLTTPIISSISNTGTLTLPTSTDTLVGRATTDTLTNKTLTSATLTNPVINTGVSGTAFLDDDTFATATASTLASSESIKAYVDTTVAATNEVVEDTTPQLGGDLDLNSSNITGTGNINITGTITSSGNITGTLATAAQPNITSVGTLTGLTSSGTINVNNSSGYGNLELGGASGGFVDFKTPFSDDHDARIIYSGSFLQISTANDEPILIKHNNVDKLVTSSAGITITGRTLVSDDQTNDWIKQEVSGTTSTISLGNTESTGATAQWSYNRSSGLLSGNIGAAAGTNFMTVKGTGNIGFGTDDPDGKVHILKNSAGTVSAATDANTLVLEDNNTGMTFLGGNTSVTRIRFGDADSNARGQVFYNHNSDSFGFQTAGSTKLVLTQDGELGLGITNPSDLLDVRGDGADTYIRVGSDTVAGNDAARIGKIDSSTDFIIQASLGSTSSNTIFKRNTSQEVARFDTSGNFGLGTDSPDTIMEIVGDDPILTIRDTDTGQSTANARIRFAESAGGDILDNYWDVGLEPTQSLTFSKNGTEYARFNTNGNLGIGTDSPARPLHISGTDSTQLEVEQTSASSDVRMLLDAGGTSGQIQFAGASHASVPNTLSLVSENDTRFVQAGQTVMHIDSASGGQVIIGGTSALGSATFTVDSNSAAIACFDGSSASGGYLQFRNNNTAKGVLGFGSNAGASSTDAMILGSTSGNVEFHANNSEAMRIDSEGNFLIGKTTHDTNNTSGVDITTEGAVVATNDGGVSFLGNRTSSDGIIILLRKDNTTTGSIGTSGTSMTFGTGTNGAEKMRLDSDGIMLLGTTTRSIGTAGSVNKFGVAGGSNSIFPMVVFADQDTSVEGGSVILELSYDADTSYSSANYVLFTDNTSTQGSISGTGNQTVSFNTSSDRRLKENIVDTQSQLEKIKQIEVRDFNYIGNDITTTGMIAQELNEIIPNVVVEGQEDFKRHPWSIDYGKLTPYLIKAIQEQQEQIEELKKEIETFKN